MTTSGTTQFAKLPLYDGSVTGRQIYRTRMLLIFDRLKLRHWHITGTPATATRPFVPPGPPLLGTQIQAMDGEFGSRHVKTYGKAYWDDDKMNRFTEDHHIIWQENEADVMSYIMESVTLDVQRTITHCTTAYDMWNILAIWGETSRIDEIYDLATGIFQPKLSDHPSMTVYLQTIANAVHRLKELEILIPVELNLVIMLMGLGPTWDMDAKLMRGGAEQTVAQYTAYLLTAAARSETSEARALAAKAVPPGQAPAAPPRSNKKCRSHNTDDHVYGDDTCKKKFETKKTAAAAKKKTEEKKEEGKDDSGAGDGIKTGQLASMNKPTWYYPVVPTLSELSGDTQGVWMEETGRFTPQGIHSSDPAARQAYSPHSSVQHANSPGLPSTAHQLGLRWIPVHRITLCVIDPASSNLLTDLTPVIP